MVCLSAFDNGVTMFITAIDDSSPSDESTMPSTIFLKNVTCVALQCVASFECSSFRSFASPYTVSPSSSLNNTPNFKRNGLQRKINCSDVSVDVAILPLGELVEESLCVAFAHRTLRHECAQKRLLGVVKSVRHLLYSMSHSVPPSLRSPPSAVQ
eukprot:Opistho-2@46827